MKYCYKCKTHKDESNFYKDKTTKSGFRNKCKVCDNACVKLRYITTYNTNKSKCMVKWYKREDKKKNREFNLTETWINLNILSKQCTYCGSTENIGCDRIDNTKGHLITNCIPCCALCNITRQDNFSVEEMKKLGVIIKTIIISRNTR